MLADFPADKQELRQVVRDFLARQCPPELARSCDEEGRFPHELFKKMADLGWQGIPFSADVGGSEGDPLDEAIVVEQLGRVMGPLASAFVITVMTCGKTVRDLGTAEQRQRWLPPLIAGTSMMSYALTEPDAGSDAAAIRSRAVRDGAGWRLSGQKIFCTGASLSDNLLVMARTGDGPPKGSISMFVVRTDAPGVTIQNIPKLGLHPYPSCMIFFDNVALDDGDLLGEPGAGWPHLVSSLNRERLAISAMCTGMAWAALDVAVAYAAERRQFGVTIRDFEAVRERVADMAIAVESARALTIRAAWLETEGRPSTLAASMAKVRTTEAAVDTARLGMQVMGGYSYTMEYPMQRFLRDALIHPIAGGTNEIQRNIIAGELLAQRPSETRARDDRSGAGADLRGRLDHLAELARIDPPAATGLLGRLALEAAAARDPHPATVLRDIGALGLTEDWERLLEGGRATAAPAMEGWSVTGRATLLGASDAAAVGLLVPLAEGDGGVLLRIDAEDVIAAHGPAGTGAVHMQFDGLMVAAPAVIAQLDAASWAAVRDVVGAGATAILVGLADAALARTVGVVRDRSAGAADRWAGQSLKHRLADAFSQRDTAWLEMLRAVESDQPDVRSLHTAVGLHEGLAAAARSVGDCVRTSKSTGDADGTEMMAAATSTIAGLDSLVGGAHRLKARVADYALRENPRRTL